MDVRSILSNVLEGLEEDFLEYLIQAIDDMNNEDRKSVPMLKEIISPFLLDTGLVSSDEEATNKCQSISIAFGGSGTLKSNNLSTNVTFNDESPSLLNQPVKIIDNSDLKSKPKTFGATFMASIGNNSMNPISSNIAALSINSNTKLEVSAIPTTQKQLRKLKKENEVLRKIMQQEALEREREAEELLRARMLAIKASRALGKQSLTGVNINSFSLPHPSGKGDLLSDAQLILSPGRRYGLIGRNGAGKSTLLRSIAKYEINGLMHLRIMLVDQHIEGNDKTPMEYVLDADIERTSLLEEEALINSHLNGIATNPLPESLQGVNLEIAIQEVYERMQMIGVATAPQRAMKILLGLGFDESMLHKPTNKLSGGWAMRAALGAAVFANPNLLLLDEPTNHLDLHALVWLEDWILNHYQGIVIIVSHDRFFLTNVCTDILELRSILGGQKKNSLTSYVMDYKSYEIELDDRNITQKRLKEAYEKEKEKLQEFISREGRKYDNPSHQNQRRMKIKQLEKLLVDEVEDIEEENELIIILPKPNGYFSNNETLIRFNNVSFGYSNESLLFHKVEFQLNPHDRIAIVGKNGCGKTTLLQLILQEVECSGNSIQGNITHHHGCRIAMLQQHHYRGEQLDPNLTPLEHMRRLVQDNTTAVGIYDIGTREEENAQRSYLANFGCHSWKATIPVKLLSGGQRMRVALAVALYRRPDVIILDEPTNHLDRDTVRALAEALESYEVSR